MFNYSSRYNINQVLHTFPRSTIVTIDIHFILSASYRSLHTAKHHIWSVNVYLSRVKDLHSWIYQIQQIALTSAFTLNVSTLNIYEHTLSTISAYNKLIHALFTYVEKPRVTQKQICPNRNVGDLPATNQNAKSLMISFYSKIYTYIKERVPSWRITAILSRIITYVPRYRPGVALSPNYDDDNEEQKEEGRRREKGRRAPTWA